MARLEAEVKRQAAEVQSTEADLELAQVNYKRSQTLVKEGVLAKQDLDDRTREQRNAIASRQAALQSLAATRKALAVAQENRQAAQARVTQAQATLDQAQANLNSTREDLQFTRLQAPIDGIVGDIPVKIGDYVDAGDTLTQITQNNSLNLRVEVPIEQQEQLHFGLPVEIMNGQDQAIASGEITFISPQANTDAQAVLAKATFQNVDGNLRDGQSVRSRLIWQQKEGVLIPSVAISRLGGQTFVFLAESKAAPDGKPQQIARQRPVQLGKLQGNNYQVIQGVEAGDTLVVSGILNLTDGAPITPLSQQSVKP
jgi:RND family efflux transporter MFP subunit